MAHDTISLHTKNQPSKWSGFRDISRCHVCDGRTHTQFCAERKAQTEAFGLSLTSATHGPQRMPKFSPLGGPVSEILADVTFVTDAHTNIQLQYHMWGFWVWITLWGSHRYKGTCKVLNGPYLWGLLVGGSLIVRFHTHLWSICLSLSVFVKYFDCKYNMFLKICIDFIVINSLPFGHNDLGPRRSMSR